MNLFGFSNKKQPVEIQQPIIETYQHEKFYSVNRETSRTDYDFSIPAVTELINSNYIYFGLDNQYPNLLNNLYYSSPFHASIVNFKSFNLIGGGYNVQPNPGVTEADLIAMKQMEYFFNSNVLNQITSDLLIHNRICIKVTWNIEHTKVIRIDRIEPSKIRATKKVDGRVKKYAYNDDWTASLRSSQNNYVYIPAFDMYAKDETQQLYVWQGYSPGLEYYAQPVYSNAVNWLYLDGQISFYHKQNMENSINPSVVLKFPEKFANKEDEQSFVRQLKSSFTGARNAGKVLTFFSMGKDLLPEVEVLPGNQLGDDFQVTNETIIKNISFAHTINPILLGIATPGSLGQSVELEISYKIFQNTFVTPNQRTLNELVNFFYGINNIKGTFTLNPTSIL